ncbi:MAG: ribonuclease III domain-containing protein [Christensenellales bacterium]|nr:ribonuclease III domain-containing protein [Christensenellales bacterium]
MEFKFAHNALPGSLELAYLGDTIYDLYVRSHLVARNGRVGAMHRTAVKLVCAHAQAEALSRIEAMLSEEERAVARRARNVRQSPPRNADPGEYCRATALEALIGYLYVMGRQDRLKELMESALPPEMIGGAHGHHGV